MNKKVEEVNRARKVPLRTPYERQLDSRKLKITGEDPNFHYHWGIIGDVNRPTRYDDLISYGYTPVMAGEVNVVGCVNQQGGHIEIPAQSGGNHILLKMPLEDYKWHEAKREQMNNDIMNDSTLESKERARSAFKNVSNGLMSLTENETNSFNVTNSK